MSNKEIYRILAFEFANEDSQNLKISMISEMVSNLFYPNDQIGDSRNKFKLLIEKAFEQYSSNNNQEITEDNFCKAMESIEQYVNDETNERFLTKIFRRHDKDKDGFLNLEEFRQLMQNYKDKNVKEEDLNELYQKICLGNKDGVSLENFKKFSM
ncbi:hypothetical protein PPERSA_10676 [Pseudocohnilembus persalinus]|uniref:EF-hand domain-containing protein n=1 Tax=Pseudocohnilembus persalinus TaxID=266149 RepID=A0A0V0QD92_PSEPJ|nr:hypothetical protein PPERSA_10676 [Pseudocohnilembus persalinus]|eukprot:KRX00177.1 hypothetical protein PPERSA_10676 [Pseudocohnilembus persalinus]